jgi:hypothetical protein
MGSTASLDMATQQQLLAACAELRRRLRAGDPCSAEALLAAYPTLAGRDEAALELIYTEYVVREELGQHPRADEWCERFPRWREDLRNLFEVHVVMAAPGGDTAHQSRGADATPATPMDACTPPGDCPARVGRYDILGEIARGGMGVVYRARQHGLNRIVALKMILSGDHASPEERVRFRTEAEAVASLQHPNIVQVYEVGEWRPLGAPVAAPFLSLEYVEGGSLQQKLADGPLPPRGAARLTQTLAEAVEHAHKHAILHRDLKPANILLTADGLPKITDFGLAKRLQSAGDTRTGAMVGTPGYMAPEQAEGAPALQATDVYGLGAILYEMLAGRPPFQGATPLETLEQVRTHEPVPPTRLQPRLPRDLETICLKCLRKDPDRRYGSARELSEDLRRFLAGEPIHARPPRLGERAVKWARRRPAVAALLTALVAITLVGMGGIAWAWAETVHALHETELARNREHEESKRLEAALAARTIAMARLAWQGDQNDEACQLLDECPAIYRDAEWRYLHRVCHGCVATLDTGGVANRAIWLPDGRLVVGRPPSGKSGKPQIQVWDLGTVQPVIKIAGHSLALAALASTPDGSRLISACHTSMIGSLSNAVTPSGWIEVKVWDLADGRELRAFKRPISVPALTLSRDGSRLAYHRAADTMQLVDVGTARELQSLKVPAIPKNPNYRPTLALSPDGQLLGLVGLRSPPDTAGQSVFMLTPATGAVRPLLRLTTVPQFIAFSLDGQRCATELFDKETQSYHIKVWEIATGQELTELHVPSRVSTAAFSPNGQTLATGLITGTLRMWDLASSKAFLEYRGHKHQVSSLEFSPDGQRLAATSLEPVVRIWDTRPPDEPFPVERQGTITSALGD